MTKRFAIALFLLLSATAAQASNWNTESNLVDQGIDPPSVQTTDVREGIPLMDGLQIYHDKNLLDILPGDTGNPTVAVGILDVDDIYNFYKRELPPLGWKATSGRDYTRSGQTLHINARAEGKMSTVTFTLKASP